MGRWILLVVAFAVAQAAMLLPLQNTFCAVRACNDIESAIGI